MRLFYSFLSALVLTAFVSTAYAQTPAAAPGKVRVVTRNLEPFSFEKDGRRVGFAMELWDEVALATGLEFEVQTVGTAQEIIDAVQNKSADIGVGAISVTAKPPGPQLLRIAMSGTPSASRSPWADRLAQPLLIEAFTASSRNSCGVNVQVW